MASARAELTNLVVIWRAQDGVNATRTLQIAANQEATILSVLRNFDPMMLGPDSGVTNLLVIDNVPIRIRTENDPLYPNQLPLRISGPAQIRIRAVVQPNPMESGDLAHTLVVDLKDKTPLQNPSGTVVVPADATGPVRIVLESSIDLITWNDALPGTYASATQRRFFRVRAISE